MRSYLHIKGKHLWRGCACLILGIVLACCGEEIVSVDQPATAAVGSSIDVNVKINIPTAGNGGPDYMIFAVLVPKGWKAGQNTAVTYTSPSGDGVMTVLPDAVLPKNGGGLTWPAYTKRTFGNAGNLIDDMEWVVFQSDKSFSHNGNTFTGDIHVKMKVGADGNNTLVKLAYVLSDSGNGYTSDGSGTYFSFKANDTCFELTGGTGDLVDFCNPQLTIIDPPKSLDNDFVTLTFDGNVVDTPVKGQSEVYICATAYTSDGKTINVCEQTAKTLMKQTTSNSNRYQITFWPRSFFGVADGVTVVKMEYFVTDKAGGNKTGYGNTAAPFVYTFKCG